MALEQVRSLCLRRRFLFETAQNCKGCTFGPLGTELKRNILNEWWHAVVTSMGNVYPLDSSSSACDKTVKCMDEGDKSITSNSSYSGQQRAQHLTQECQDYSRYKDLLKVDIPFGFAEVGFCTQKAEVEKIRLSSSKQESGDVQFFCAPSEYRSWCSKWQKMRLRWWKKFSVNPEKFSFVKSKNDSNLNLLLGSFKFQSPSGQEYDVESMIEGNQSLWGVTNEDKPSILTLTTSLDQAVLAFIYDAYSLVTRPYAEDKTIVLRFSVSLAPFKVAVLSRDRDNLKLQMYCSKMAEELRQAGISVATGSGCDLNEDLIIQDECGTPFRVIVSEGTLKKGTVVLQDRDTTLEEEMNGQNVLNIIQRMLLGSRND